MQIARTIARLRRIQAAYRRAAFVPTRGNLHHGHLALALNNMAIAVKAGGKDFSAIEAEAMPTLARRSWKTDYMVVRRQAYLQPPHGNGPLVALGTTIVMSDLLHFYTLPVRVWPGAPAGRAC